MKNSNGNAARPVLGPNSTINTGALLVPGNVPFIGSPVMEHVLNTVVGARTRERAWKVTDVAFRGT